MDYSVAISLLTINVIILSIVVVAILTLIIVLLVHLNKLAKKVEKVADNMVSTTDWLKPSKVFGSIRNLFR